MTILTNPEKEAGASLDHSEAQVNNQFKIKVTGRNFVGPALNQFVGITGLVKIFGKYLAYKYINKAMQSQEDNPTYHNRRGMKIVFYSIL